MGAQLAHVFLKDFKNKTFIYSANYLILGDKKRGRMRTDNLTKHSLELQTYFRKL